jgi:hypothetical protein
MHAHAQEDLRDEWGRAHGSLPAWRLTTAPGMCTDTSGMGVALYCIREDGSTSGQSVSRQ